MLGDLMASDKLDRYECNPIEFDRSSDNHIVNET